MYTKNQIYKTYYKNTIMKNTNTMLSIDELGLSSEVTANLKNCSGSQTRLSCNCITKPT